MVLASALLVVAVLQTKALVEWPISLLVEAQRKALDPAGDALTRLWAGSASVALLAAFCPASPPGISIAGITGSASRIRRRRSRTVSTSRHSRR